MNKQVVILAGGKGTRLRPFTHILPKPLMPVGEKAILEIIYERLKAAGFTESICTLGYLGHLIQALLGDGSKFGISTKYYTESEPLGTAGGILKLAKDKLLQDKFFVTNADILSNIDLNDIWNFHQDGSITVVAAYRKIQVELGVLEMDQQNILQNYREKPSIDYWASTGMYVMNRIFVESLPFNGRLDLPDLVNYALKNKIPVRVFKIPTDKIWLDLGRAEDFEKAQDLIDQK